MKNRPVIGIRLPVWAGSTLPVFGGVVDYMRTHKLWRLVTENDSYGEMERIKIGEGWQGNGLILYRASHTELADFKKRGLAVVLLSTEGEDAGYPRILPDNHAAGKLAAEHLLSLGHREFAFLGRGETLYREEEYAPGMRRYARERLAGFKEALHEAGYEPKSHYLPGFPLWEKNTWQDVEAAIREFLLTLPAPTGLFAVDDALGAAVLSTAEKMEIKIPSELSVIGFGNDLQYCHTTLPALSSIAYPAREAGYLAAHHIARQLDNTPIESDIPRIPVSSVFQRESSDMIAIDDDKIMQIIQWIRLRAPHEAIQVSDIAKHFGSSLGSLRSRFRKHVGHTPKDEIKRVRLEHLRRLLLDQQLSLAEITESMQFSSPHEMSRFFLHETGERPTTYRERCRRQQITSPQSPNTPQSHTITFPHLESG